MSSIVKADSQTESESESRESKNTLYTVLGNHRRRYVLYACNQANGEATLGDVAEQVAAWEYDKPVEQITSTERKRVYTSIQQHHLSKLEEAELLEVENDRLSTTERAENLDLYLEIVPEDDIPWAIYYLGLSIIGGIAVGLVGLGLLPEFVSVSVVAVLLVCALAVSAVVHVHKSRQMRFNSADIPPEIES